MSSNGQQTPDLASILKTLSDLNSQNQQQQSQQESQPQPQSQPQSQSQPTVKPQAQPYHAYQQAWQQQLEIASQSQKPSAPTNTPPNVVEPASIIEWSAGLRCVMKTVAKHDNIINEIRRMINVQHEHEEQWFNGREALIEKQKGREEGQKKLDEVLKAVGGAISTAPSNNTPEELAKELQTFDMKVHRAQMQMVREMSTRLRGFGVPFFGTKGDLVKPARKEVESGPGKDESGMIDEAELVKLQRKMLAFLEDLCSE
ncbi:hypothetical protein LOCC1_G007083 [Lachnellula occidentalis]|uniref:Uncharacterized protein n=1 Tax=Lachnellula occidentalis TaxID=215460 RepID=A0A8H8U716_9HELO|nr:hypothetical protein LOCC1_G007083 [Lachnellula occidentalis]